MKFAAIDFETADHGRDSACALAIVRVEEQRIIRQSVHLIRPPREEFFFSWIHGITWEDVAGRPTFGELWPAIADELAGVDFLAAHNAPFDRSVLYECCRAAGVPPPEQPFRCTVRLARAQWRLPSASLPIVCAHLGIPLRHHDPASDAAACARILLAALEEGAELPPFMGTARRTPAKRRPAIRYIPDDSAR